MLTPELLRAVLDGLALPVLLMGERAVLYSNAAAERLAQRLKTEHATELHVLLRDHIEAIGGQFTRGGVFSLVTAGNGEPFYVHATPLSEDAGTDLALVTVRELAPDRTAFQHRYGLSPRETEVVTLVLRGYGNRDIADALGITAATTKKHLTSVFNKVGVDSRAQLISRLA